MTTTKAQTEIASSVDSSTNPLLQQSDIGNSSLNNNKTNGNILIRGIISSEPGQPEQLKVQRTIILPHRQDGNDYTGILTYTAIRPVEVLLGHRLGVDNKTLLSIDTKKFGNLFLVNPIHPNVGYVLSAPTVIRSDYADFSPPILFCIYSLRRELSCTQNIRWSLFCCSVQNGCSVINNLTTAETNMTSTTK